MHALVSAQKMYVFSDVTTAVGLFLHCMSGRVAYVYASSHECIYRRTLLLLLYVRRNMEHHIIQRLFSSVNVDDLVLINVFKNVRSVHEDANRANRGHDEEHVQL